MVGLSRVRKVVRPGREPDPATAIPEEARAAIHGPVIESVEILTTVSPLGHLPSEVARMEGIGYVYGGFTEIRPGVLWKLNLWRERKGHY